MLKNFPCMNVLPQAGPAELVTVVSGLPRSGTSMLMRALTMGGIPPLTDQVRRQDARNPHGYFEFEAVKDKHHYRHWISLARGKAVKVVSRFLPYLPPSQEYRILFLHRDMDAIVRSQQDMASHYSGARWDRQETERLKQAYHRHLAEVLDWVEQRPNMHLLLLNYEGLTSAPDGPLRAIRNFLAPQELCLSTMAAAIDPSLNHSRTGSAGEHE